MQAGSLTWPLIRRICSFGQLFIRFAYTVFNFWRHPLIFHGGTCPGAWSHGPLNRGFLLTLVESPLLTFSYLFIYYFLLGKISGKRNKVFLFNEQVFNIWASVVAQLVKNLSAMQETSVRFMAHEVTLDKG